jgi:hypothetical protein
MLRHLWRLFHFDLDRFAFISFVTYSTWVHWASSFFCTYRQVADIDIYLKPDPSTKGRKPTPLSRRVLARLNYTYPIVYELPFNYELGAELLGELCDLLGWCRLLTMFSRPVRLVCA